VVRDFDWDNYYYSGPILYDEEDNGDVILDDMRSSPTQEPILEEHPENSLKTLLDISERLESTYYHEKTTENVQKMALLQDYHDRGEFRAYRIVILITDAPTSP
jgi:hypothetical protein